MSRDPPVFRPNWGVHINNRVIQPGMATEILEKLPLPWVAVAGTQYSFPDLKGLFANLLMQVGICLGIAVICASQCG